MTRPAVAQQGASGGGRGFAGAASPGPGLFAEPANLGLRHDVVAAELSAAHFAGVDELPQPFGTVARRAGRIGNQDQLLVLHEADYIAPRQYRTTLALLLPTNYNIGVEQYSEEVMPPSTRRVVPPAHEGVQKQRARRTW